jgi:hypothetical protein
MGRRQVFLVWATILTAVWVFANWPQAISSLKREFVIAGCPWIFAGWERGRLECFRPAALAADVAVWVGLMLLAWLCGWSRTSHSRQDGKAG